MPAEFHFEIGDTSSQQVTIRFAGGMILDDQLVQFAFHRLGFALKIVVDDFDTLLSDAMVTLENSRVNDGLSIDDISVGVIPLPASALMLLAGLGAIGGIGSVRARRLA